jgi:hypothetical protein
MKTTKTSKNRKSVKNDRKIKTNFEMMKLILPMYQNRLNDQEQLRVLFDQFRNSIFDTTQNKEFKNGFISVEARKAYDAKLPRNHFTSDHIVRRIHGISYLFKVLSDNPRMGFRTFKKHLKEVGQQVLLTQKEHQKVNQLTKGNDKINVEVYTELGIQVVGYNHRGRPKNWELHVKKRVNNIYRRIDLK